MQSNSQLDSCIRCSDCGEESRRSQLRLNLTMIWHHDLSFSLCLRAHNSAESWHCRRAGSSACGIIKLSRRLAVGGEQTAAGQPCRERVLWQSP